MLAIKQKTKNSSLIKFIFKNNIINFFLLIIATLLEIYYFQSYIFAVFLSIFFPIFFLRYKLYHTKEYFQFFDKLLMYKNPYQEDIIIYYDDISDVKMKYDIFSGKYICIEIKNKSVLKYDNEKYVKIYHFLNYQNVIATVKTKILY